MRSVARLVDAICEAYRMATDNGPFAPAFSDGRWYTHCNEAFNLVAKRMGVDEFDKSETKNPHDARLANMIHAMMFNESGKWRQIDASMAQRMANDGALVAAVKDNASGPGHICVVMPGILEYSESFGYSVPKVMNVGKDVFIGKKVSHAFQSKEKPLYFCLKDDFRVES